MYDLRDTRLQGGLQAITLEGDDSLVEVVPSRGGLVTRFRVAGDELLFLDPETLADPSKNVRGGIPVLFPFAGRAPDAGWKQHGFARDLPWEVTARHADQDGARVSLKLTASEATRGLYPYDFTLALDVVLQPARLVLDFAVTNHDARPLPHALGIHPYLRVPDASKDDAHVETDATTGWDNRRKIPLAVGEPDFTADELDWHLHDHSLPGTLLVRKPLRPIRFEWTEDFGTLVLWTLKGRDFVCVEPWVAPAGAFPDGAAVRQVEPGATDRLRVAISV